MAAAAAGGVGVGGKEGEMKLCMMSMGTGKMMVEFFSAEMELRVWKVEKREEEEDLRLRISDLLLQMDLQVSQLDGGRRFGHDVRRLAKGPAGLLFSFCGDDLNKMQKMVDQVEEEEVLQCGQCDHLPWRGPLWRPQPRPPWPVAVAPAIGHPCCKRMA